MTYIGIDPGRKGAVAFIDDFRGNFVYQWDPDKFVEDMYNTDPENAIVCLEHVHAMPGQGVTSMFNFGQSFGFIQGVLTAYRIPFQLVQPQKWKKEFSVTSDKNTSIAVCKRLFPEVSLLPTDRSKKESDGMAEALLLAEYGRRKFGR